MKKLLLTNRNIYQSLSTQDLSKTMEKEFPEEQRKLPMYILYLRLIISSNFAKYLSYLSDHT